MQDKNTIFKSQKKFQFFLDSAQLIKKGKYAFSQFNASIIIEIISQLFQYCNLTWEELFENKKTYHFHKIEKDQFNKCPFNSCRDLQDAIKK
ncbi:hypothetical protein [Candidatus Phytoplasma fraxini]|uniref:Uncharacterized protein n=1 Tax=Ash yellows phytoplasma TaxID=35780 RepID=A0ABZ2U9J5_ASHYP